MSRERIERHHPKLRPENYTVESPRSKRYNCFAWVTGDNRRWWEPFNPLWDLMDLPGRYWPSGEHAPLTVDSLVRALGTEGYIECETGELEQGVEKVAVYAKDLDGEPTHTAVQLETGIWASKLGRWEDIHHRTVQDLEDEEYGRAIRFLKRPR